MSENHSIKRKYGEQRLLLLLKINELLEEFVKEDKAPVPIEHRELDKVLQKLIRYEVTNLASLE